MDSNGKGRWVGVERPYAQEDVERLRGRFRVEHTLARLGAERLWKLLGSEPYVAALGALTGAQAVQMVKAGLQAIYLSGWQVAADANLSGHTYPDQSLYPANSAPALVARLNNALLRADQIDAAEDKNGTYWLAPIVADAEAGFGGPLNAFELMKSMIEAGAAGVHFEDQLSSEKKCGHLGGKVLVPTSQFVQTLVAARLAADVLDVPTVLVARTDALSATLLTSDVDERDREFLTGERTPEGFFHVAPGIEAPIARALAYAPYADLLWCETSTPDLDEAAQFAEAVHARFPGKLLAYNCSPSFNWKRHLDDKTIASFQRELADMGYAFQFVTLAGFHAVCESMFDLARGYARDGMSAYVELQQREFALEEHGYTATRHQREVGAGLLRRRARGDLGRRELHARAQGVDRGGAVRGGAHRMSSVAAQGVTVRGADEAGVLTPEALELVAALQRELGGRREELLRARAERQERIAAGELPTFLEETRSVREGRVARRGGPGRPPGPPRRDHGPGRRPQDGDQRVQLGREDVHGGLRGRELADLGERRRRPAEPHRRDRAHDLGRDAGQVVRAEGRRRRAPRASSRLAPARAARRDRRRARLRELLRLRRLPPAERAAAARARERPVLLPPQAREPPRGPPLERRVHTARRTGSASTQGTIKATVLIETILAAFEMEEILYELREHSAGLNAGRWDYIFSVIKKFSSRDDFVLPDRVQVTMTVPFMRAYTELLVRTCHARGAHAIGGMAAFIPSRRDAEVNEIALARVREDKQRESGDGFDGTWVAHPGPRPDRDGGSSTPRSATGRTSSSGCARTSRSTRRTS